MSVAPRIHSHARALFLLVRRLARAVGADGVAAALGCAGDLQRLYALLGGPAAVQAVSRAGGSEQVIARRPLLEWNSDDVGEGEREGWGEGRGGGRHMAVIIGDV